MHLPSAPVEWVWVPHTEHGPASCQGSKHASGLSWTRCSLSSLDLGSETELQGLRDVREFASGVFSMVRDADH